MATFVTSNSAFLVPGTGFQHAELFKSDKIQRYCPKKVLSLCERVWLCVCALVHYVRASASVSVLSCARVCLCVHVCVFARAVCTSARAVCRCASLCVCASARIRVCVLFMWVRGHAYAHCACCVSVISLLWLRVCVCVPLYVYVVGTGSVRRYVGVCVCTCVFSVCECLWVCKNERVPVAVFVHMCRLRVCALPVCMSRFARIIRRMSRF
jgi:hypothetical protein